MRPAAACVHIVGKNSLQNELLLSFIKTETDLDCNCSFRPVFDSLETGAERNMLVLLECQIAEEIGWWGVSRTKRIRINTIKVPIALWNVDKTKTELEINALVHGLRGVFYNDTPLATLTRGVKAILGGELWYSRKTLSQVCLHPKPASREIDDLPVTLTSREKEIIGKFLSGASNKQIADELCVSLYTVKTQIYKLFKKLNVNNRLQAANWAQKFIS